MKSADLQQSQLDVTGHLNGSDLVAFPDGSFAVAPAAARAFDLAPPIRQSIPLYQTISVLRI